MIAKLEFNLPEESEEHRVALDGGKWLGVVRDLSDALRNLEKYEGDKVLAPSEVRKILYGIIGDWCLTLD